MQLQQLKEMNMASYAWLQRKERQAEYDMIYMNESDEWIWYDSYEWQKWIIWYDMIARLVRWMIMTCYTWLRRWLNMTWFIWLIRWIWQDMIYMNDWEWQIYDYNVIIWRTEICDYDVVMWSPVTNEHEMNYMIIRKDEHDMTCFTWLKERWTLYDYIINKMNVI